MKAAVGASSPVGVALVLLIKFELRTGLNRTRKSETGWIVSVAAIIALAAKTDGRQAEMALSQDFGNVSAF